MAQTVVQYIYRSTTWVAPPGVTSVQAEAWGAGGNGSTRTTTGRGGGASGGTYAKTNAITVTPGSSYTVNVGVQASVSDSWFSTTGSAPTTTAQGVLAKAGISVANNTTTGASAPGTGSCIGDTVADGGAGANSGTPGGGGGEAGGPNGAGHAASGAVGGTGNADAGDGGAGGASGNNPGGDANSAPEGVGPYFCKNGESVGGGGGGASRTSGTQSGGKGGGGLIRLTYTIPSGPFCVGVSQVSVNAGTGLWPLDVPAGTQDGDLMIFHSVGGGSPPAGFTQAGSSNCYTKLASSEPSTYTITGGGYGQAELMVFRGVSSATPNAVNSGTSTSSTTIDPGSITPAVANSLIVFVVGSVSPNPAVPGYTLDTFAISTDNPTWIKQYQVWEFGEVALTAMAWAQRSQTTATGTGSVVFSSAASAEGTIMAFSPQVAATIQGGTLPMMGV